MWTHTNDRLQYMRLADSWFKKIFLTTMLSHWDFSHGEFGLLSPGKPAATEPRYPSYSAYCVFSCFRNPRNTDMDHWIFNLRTDVKVCDCTRGCSNTRKRVCTESWQGENSLPYRGMEPASAVCRSDALPTELHPQSVYLGLNQPQRSYQRE